MTVTTLAEDLLLMLIDPASGRVIVRDRVAVSVALGGAILLDLSLQDKLDSDRNAIWVVDDSPTGDGVNDTVLSWIAQEESRQAISTWVYRLYGHAHDMRARLLISLVRKQIVRSERRRVLRLFSVQRYKPENANVEEELKQRIREVLFSTDIPSPHDVCLVSLANSAGLLDRILLPEAHDLARERISQIARMELVAHSVSGVIEDVYQALARPVFAI